MDIESIGPYRILRLLGEGGMASAYLARHETLQKSVVLKVVKPAFAGVESYRERFLREARSLARLSHPNIVQVFDARVEGQHCYLAMEYVEGKDLQSFFRRKEPVDLGFLLKALQDVAAGLQCVHDAGLVHRDIKPANILITNAGHAKITDFGVALESEDAMRLTLAGMIVGTPLYMSPEQALGKRVDGRADQYSLGVVLYQGVSGRTPFRAETPTAMLVKHAHEQPVPLSRLAPDTPAIVLQIVDRLLAKKPEERYPSARELRQDLAKALETVKGAKAPEKIRPPTQAKRVPVQAARPAADPGRLWALVGGGGVALLLVILLLAKLFSSGERPKAPEPPVVTGTEKPPDVTPSPGPRVDPPKTTPPKEASPAETTPPKIEPPQPSPPVDPPKPAPDEMRRQLEALFRVENLAGAAAFYCEMKGMKDQAAELWTMMAEIESKVEPLREALHIGTEPFANPRIRPGDRLSMLDNRLLSSLGDGTAIAILGNFVANVRPDSRLHVCVHRDRASLAFTIVIDPVPPEIDRILRIAELVPGQTLLAAEVNPTTLFLPRPRPPKVPKPSVPDEAAQKKAEKLIREIFKEDYARTSAAGKGALVEKLFTEAIATADDWAARFVLFREARDLAAEEADVTVSRQVISEMAKFFNIDTLAMRNDALLKAGRNARSSEEFRAVAKASFRLATEAMEIGELDLAEGSVASASTLGRRAKDISLISRADALSKEIAELRSRQEKVKKAQGTLASAPEDPAANLAVGQFLCMIKADWNAGLPLLSKASDAALKELARKDLASPQDPEARTAVGDGWWDLAETRPEVEKRNLRKRAAYWYEQAVPRLSGLVRIQVEKRLARAGVMNTWLDVTEPELFGLTGARGEAITLTPSVGRYRLVSISPLPAGDFDGVSLRIRIGPNRNVVGSLALERGNRLMAFEGPSSAFGVLKVEGRADPLFDVLARKWTVKDTYVITVLIEEGEYVCFLDDVEMVRLEAAEDRLTYIGLRADSGAVTFDQIRIRKKE